MLRFISSPGCGAIVGILRLVSTLVSICISVLALGYGDNWCERLTGEPCPTFLRPSTDSYIAINAPTPTPTIELIDRSGCSCVEQDKACHGLIVGEKTMIPASSIFKPPSSNSSSNPKVHVFREAGEAPEDGMVWSYVDNQGRPALQSCVDNELSHAFQLHQVIPIGE